MNNATKILAGLAGLTLSVAVQAGQIAPQTNGGASTISASTDCTLITEDVTVNLSANVAGGYNCNTASNVIAFAGCSTAGRKYNNTTNNYIYYGTTKGGSVHADTPSTTCSEGNAETVATNQSS